MVENLVGRVTVPEISEVGLVYKFGKRQELLQMVGEKVTKIENECINKKLTISSIASKLKSNRGIDMNMQLKLNTQS